MPTVNLSLTVCPITSWKLLLSFLFGFVVLSFSTPNSFFGDAHFFLFEQFPFPVVVTKVCHNQGDHDTYVYYKLAICIVTLHVFPWF